MADDFESLGRRLEARSKRFIQRVEKGVRQAALLADSVAVLGTPFDTGRARGGWQVSFGAPDFSEGGLDPGGQATLSRHQPTILSFRVDQRLFMANAVPYIGRLENPPGHSPQGHSFAKAAAEAARSFLRRFRFLD